MRKLEWPIVVEKFDTSDATGRRLVTLHRRAFAVWIDSRLQSWAPGQAAGPPDALPGDSPNAWASRGGDDRREWLELSYADPVIPRAIVIYENLAPGAVDRITAYRTDAADSANPAAEEIWHGVDPLRDFTPNLPGNSRPGSVARISLNMTWPTEHIRVEID